MNKLIGATLAAVTIGAAVVSAAQPAAARDWRGGFAHSNWSGREGGGWREHDGWRERGGWRGGDRDWDDGWRWRGGGFYYGFGPSCYGVWRWNPYWGRYVRVTYCD